MMLFIVLIAASIKAQTISYILPDIGSPGMNTYIEIIGPTGASGNFGTDGFYLNNPGDAVRVECVRPSDTAMVTLGPCVVSWNGKMVSTQLFVHPDAQPNSPDWRMLRPEFVIPIRVVVNGTPSNSDTIYIIQTAPALTGASGSTFGQSGFGMRSRRGAMIVDSVRLPAGSFGVSTIDCDPGTDGNQAFLPFILISRGPVTGVPGSSIQVNASGKNAGAGGGGGGGKYCDDILNTLQGSNGGGGFTGGGRGGKNGSSVPFNPNRWEEPGESSGSRINNTGASLNGVTGGTGPLYEASSGGTGHPFGTSGEGCNDGAGCNPPGGFGGGSGQQQNRSGGGGGYGTSGSSSASGNGGAMHGNDQLVPLAGGSGGASGNPQGINVCSGEGGGGGGAIRIAATRVTDIDVSSLGGSGQVSSFGVGGSGSGGGISIETRLLYDRGQINTRGGETGLSGGAGRIRIDGPRNTIIVSPSTASFYSGPSTDTTQWVPRTFILTGTGGGDTVHLYMKSVQSPWFLYASIPIYTNNGWAQSITLPGTGDLYYLAAVQDVRNPQVSNFAMEPPTVMSQAGANIFRYSAVPKISAAARIVLPPLLCESGATDTVIVRNEGDAVLLVRDAYASGSTGAISVAPPSPFPVTVAPKDSVRLVITYRSRPGKTGLYRDTLLVFSNDSASGRSPWRIAVSFIKDSVGLATLQPRLDFGSLVECRGRTVDTVITLLNTGSLPVRVIAPVITAQDVVLVSPPPGSFPVMIDTVTRQMPIRVRYAPAQAGTPMSGTITFQSNAAACSRVAQVPLSGRLDSASLAAPSSIVFPGVSCFGETAEITVEIVNGGTADDTLRDPIISNTRFSIVSPPLPAVVPAGGRIPVTVRFSPGAPGAESGSVSLTGALCDLPVSFLVSGRRDSIGLAASGHDFGVVEPTQFPVTTTLVIRNTGTATLAVTRAQFATGTPFTVTAGIPVTIPAGDSALVTVRFDNPGSDGIFSDVLIYAHQPTCGPAVAAIRGTRGTAAITLEVDTLSAAPGEYVDVPIYLRASINPQLFGATGIATRLRFDKNILAPEFLPAGFIQGDERIIPLTLPLTGAPGVVLATLRFRAMLGTVETTALTLDSSSGIGGRLAITEIPGAFQLTGVCREGGTRLYDGGVRAALKQNTPNPFNPRTTIEYRVIERGEHELLVSDRLGKTVAVLMRASLEPGVYTADFNGSNLPSGVYYYTLRTPTGMLTRSMVVLK